MIYLENIHPISLDSVQQLGGRIIFVGTNQENSKLIHYVFCNVEYISTHFNISEIENIKCEVYSEFLKKYLIKHSNGTDFIICDRLEIEEVEDDNTDEVESDFSLLGQEVIKTLISELKTLDPNNRTLNIITQVYPELNI
ncbi:hypothetical protein Fleli_3484 [Bernardetia litoralis DSM 6794]|uniref:Uncharacterized protein n=1 Tax=Bernardetia litoralis (strain ATCC 23117 / DSM 6794 / NBRC 15988 / NCIMB 1366 / Fx l1 / Sio-4) TaxID=880071 RepID=I4AFZ5_BERLS|nr:hypothetical protein [Bernardetia litoralis]AFM02880.1 hypothetical protein Fleli_0404 [Bernardetia litoralis DSM 6794]AFM05804.1 hypothetical protein Fleli_3484 [Bernardetia litoralis DSM 6794]